MAPSVFLPLAFLLALTSSLVTAASDRAFLLVSKSVKLKKLRDRSEEVTVSFSIYNTGSSIAYDVALRDDNWPSETFDVVGNTTKGWEKLEGGGSLAHSFLLRPKAQAEFAPSRAVVTFRITTKSQPQTAYSTPVPVLGLLQPESEGARWAWLKDLVQQFGPLVSALGIVALIACIVFVPISSKKSSKKRR